MKITGAVLPWCSGYHYCTASFNNTWTQVLRRFKSCTLSVGDSWWWGSRLEIRLNAFRRSTISQKQFIISIIIINPEVDFTFFVRRCRRRQKPKKKRKKPRFSVRVIFRKIKQQREYSRTNAGNENLRSRILF